MTVEHSRIINAALSLVSEIISDLDTYHQHTPPSPRLGWMSDRASN